MKYLFRYLEFIILTTALLFGWFDIGFIPSPLWVDVLCSCLFVLILICQSILDWHSDKQKTTIKTLFNRIILLDDNDDTNTLRTIRTLVNRKLSRSQTNKYMIQASKDICGKNCKCTELRKENLCIDCDVYKAYVEYLKQVSTK